MTHIEVYTIKGQKYKYEVTNYRVGKKVKHQKKYLGPVDPKYKTAKKEVNNNGVHQIKQRTKLASATKYRRNDSRRPRVLRGRRHS